MIITSLWVAKPATSPHFRDVIKNAKIYFGMTAIQYSNTKLQVSSAMLSKLKFY